MSAPYTLEFTLAGLPRTGNQRRVHWRVLKREADTWKGAVHFAVCAAGGAPPKPLKRALVTLTRFSSVEPDFDNLVTSFKNTLDGLRVAGVIADDKRAVIGAPKYEWRKAAPKEGRVVVRVEEVRNG